MIDGFYRIGQASKQLAVSSYHLRRLCQAGLIEAELTSGNQWRIPISEVERLQQDGVPPIPQVLNESDSDSDESDGEPDPPVARDSRLSDFEGLYAPPSENVIGAAEEVAITENRLRKRRLERELEQEEDFFRERAAREQEQAKAERERARKDRQAQQRREWENAWITHAMNHVPSDAPRELLLDVHANVAEALAKTQPDHPALAVRRLIEAAVEKALAPWRAALQQRRAVQTALDSLPFDLRNRREYAAQKQEAMRLAATAVTQCAPGTSYNTLVSTAREAVEPTVRAFDHLHALNEVAAWITVRGATHVEIEEAKELVSAALAKLPAGCSRARMERAREDALDPLRARIAAREHAEAALLAQQRQHQDAERRIDWLLDHVDRYLDEAYEYPTFYERSDDARRLKKKIRPALIAECVAGDAIDSEDIRSRIEELVDEWI